MKTMITSPLVQKVVAAGTLFAMNFGMITASYAQNTSASSTVAPYSARLFTTEQEIEPISFDEILGIDESTGDTLFIDIDSAGHILDREEWYLIQVYVHSAFALPTTEAAMKSTLRFDENLEFSSDYRALLEEYININSHAQYWNNSMYPSIVDLSLQLANYTDIHMVFIQPLVTTLGTLVSQSIELQTIGLIHGEDSEEYTNLVASMNTNIASAKQYLTLLTIFSNSRLDAVEEAKQDLFEFATTLSNQSVSLGVFSNIFHEVLNQDNTEELRARIDDINTRIQEINDEIAKKKRDVGLTAIGGAISLLVGGTILGIQIENLKSEAKNLRNELDDLEGELAHAVAIYQSYTAATISIDNIDQTIEAALPKLEILKTHWHNMRGEFDDLKIALDSAASEVGLENLDILLGIGTTAGMVELANKKWSAIGKSAREFVNNAYVVIE